MDIEAAAEKLLHKIESKIKPSSMREEIKQALLEAQDEMAERCAKIADTQMRQCEGTNCAVDLEHLTTIRNLILSLKSGAKSEREEGEK